MTFIAFNSNEEWEDYWKRDREARVDGLNDLTEEQKKIGPGSFVTLVDPHGIRVWGYIFTLKENLLSEIEHSSEAELMEIGLDYTISQFTNSLEIGTLFGLWFSAPYPDSELGSHYIGMMEKEITEDEFWSAAVEHGAVTGLNRWLPKNRRRDVEV